MKDLLELVARITTTGDSTLIHDGPLSSAPPSGFEMQILVGLGSVAAKSRRHSTAKSGNRDPINPWIDHAVKLFLTV
jgi:hypothetical protein